MSETKKQILFIPLAATLIASLDKSKAKKSMFSLYNF